LTYNAPDHQTFRIGEGGMFGNLEWEALQKANEQCGMDASYYNAKSAVKVYRFVVKHAGHSKK